MPLWEFVPRAGAGDQPGAGDGPGEGVRGTGADSRVVLAVDDQRRHMEAAQLSPNAVCWHRTVVSCASLRSICCRHPRPVERQLPGMFFSG